MDVHNVEHEQVTDEIDPIWTTSRTARQIYALGDVEKVIHSFVDFWKSLKAATGHFPTPCARSVVHIVVDFATDRWS